MADCKAKLADNGFCNWIKANLAISMTKTGLQDSVCNKLQTIHKGVLDDVWANDQKSNDIRCFDCFTQNVIRCSSKYPCNQLAKVCPFHQQMQFRECPNGICDKIRDKIIQSHVFNKPSWKNTRADMWCNSYWEYTKCFMPPNGYSDKNSFLETDLNGIISVVTNHFAFAKEIDDKDVCKHARSIVNDLRHNSDISVGDQQLEEIITSLKQFLTCSEELRNSSQASEARLKLEKLKTDSITNVTEEDVKRFLKNQYHDLVKDLKDDLIQFIKEEHGTTSISPILEETDSPLLELYVPPTIIRFQSGDRHGNENRKASPVTTLNDVFFGPDGRFHEIYLCSETGLGKTVYGKRLALMWCQSNEADQNESNFTRDEIDVMKSFDFVFYISLKESDDLDRDVDDMIEQQIIKKLARASAYKTEFIEKILTLEDCLIILDGLDEWSHAKEDIPRRKPRKACTYFTTTRPWKFTIAKIKQSKIDQQLEITGMDTAAKQKLKSFVSKNIVGNEAENKPGSQWIEFEEQVAKRNIMDFETSPMLLLYLLCLWLDNKPLGNSRCDLYSNIVEMMLHKSVKGLQIPKLPKVTINIPRSFQSNEQCCKYFTFIQELACLAFITLFKQQTGNKFVFADALAKENMSGQCLEFWLRAGILTQIKGKKSFTTRDIRVSFIHKSFHEFFAALYMALTEPEYVAGIVQNACDDLNSILLTANTFEFLSGLNPTRSKTIINSLVALLGKDEFTQRLRNYTYTFLDYWEICDLKGEFQNMMVACVNESKDNGYKPDYHLEDIFLNFGEEAEERYVEALCDLTSHNDVKSIKFGRSLCQLKAHELIKRLNVQDMKSLQKLEFWGQPGSEDVASLLGASHKTLTCLLIHGCEMSGDKEYEKHIEISEVCFSKLQTLDNLACIDLYCIALKHELIEKLFGWLEKKKSMSQIKIARVMCTDHLGNTCQSGELTFDLSGHRDLKIIGLGNIGVSTVKVDSLALEEFWAECNECFVTSFLNSHATSALKLHTFVVEFIESTAIVEQILDTLPQLNYLCCLQLKKMDLRQRELKLTSQKTVKHVRLIEIEMECRALKNLIDECGTYSHPVTVEIAACVVRPDRDNESISFEKLRDMILVSDKKFTVISNVKCSGHNNAFAFRTCVSQNSNGELAS